jgi:hypothetical protein
MAIARRLWPTCVLIVCTPAVLQHSAVASVRSTPEESASTGCPDDDFSDVNSGDATVDHPLPDWHPAARQCFVPPAPYAPNPNATGREKWEGEVDALLSRHWKAYDGYGLPPAERAVRGDDSLTYGEVTARGIRQLMAVFLAAPLYQNRTAATPNNGMRFYDLGSGVGKAVAQVAVEYARSVRSAVGVELMQSRHTKAHASLAALASDGAAISLRATIYTAENNQSDDVLPPVALPLPPINNVAHAVHGDILTADIHNATHIYLCSLCFSPELLAAVAVRVATACPDLVAAATLLPFPEPLPSALQLVRSDVYVEMSWTRGYAGQVYIYSRNPSA